MSIKTVSNNIIYFTSGAVLVLDFCQSKINIELWSVNPEPQNSSSTISLLISMLGNLPGRLPCRRTLLSGPLKQFL
ncbi:hypothetical protein Y032_0229g2906 [Ancylostoma ceylanicum]|uniref:Uncharacterized protein n=1 Tax=Ancylostoma ceylanicum TaxID=53326 RepID=A0A016SH14_9BILA|nr:hypothetical protein Y032_0229g2906 [Ancylostoma ceylanicum]